MTGSRKPASAASCDECPADRHADPLAADRAERGLDAAAAAAFDDEADDLAILDDVDAEPARRPRVAPGDRVVARRAGAALPDAAMDRKPRRGRKVERRRDAAHVGGGKELGVDAVDLHGVDGSRGELHLGVAVADRHHAARREHDVEVQLRGEALVEPMGEGVERDAFGIEIVGADDGRVPPGVAAADPPFLQHGDAREAVRLGEIVGRGEAVAAAADDDGVIGFLWLRRAPGRLPAGVAGEAFP